MTRALDSLGLGLLFGGLVLVGAFIALVFMHELGTVPSSVDVVVTFIVAMLMLLGAVAAAEDVD